MTPHNEAKKEEIAKIVIMPGDPLRAKYIAENFMEEVKLVNSVRNVYAYTGKYKGKEITVMASGMGMPSMGIYAYELYKIYDVDVIIRIGSCGTHVEDLELLDTVLVNKSYTEGNFALTQNNEKCNVVEATKEINDKIEEVAKELNIKCISKNVFCSEVFDYYITDINELYNRLPKELNLAVSEMESFALFYLAKILNKKAACLLTVVDSHCKNTQISSEDREKSLKDMIILALETSVKI